jgi:hypothetical protein
MAVTSSIPAVIDWLVAHIGALPECAAPVVVSDGWPLKRNATGVEIGVTPEDSQIENQAMPAQLGGQLDDEQYDIPITVRGWTGGTSQKTARDTAFTIANAIWGLLRTHPTVDDLLNSGAVQITDTGIRQTGDVASAGQGRRCEVRFTVHCRNRF